MSKQFSAGALFLRNPKTQDWYVLAASVYKTFYSGRWIQNNTILPKLPGGTNREKKFFSEKPHKTFIREFIEETGLKPKQFILVRSTEFYGGASDEKHFQHYYLVQNFSGSFFFDCTRKFKDGKDKVRVEWWSLNDFIASSLINHLEGFRAAFLAKAKTDEEFRTDNLEIFYKFSREISPLEK